MPGAYAHITLVNELATPATLNAIDGLPVEARKAVLKYLKFCELGAVSPDYPYLKLGDANAARWADAMHYTRVGETIKAGIGLLQGRDDPAGAKCLAWLLGYAAHVATDVTIHPVVELKVGEYAEHKAEHRTCEMHQDAHVFPRLNLGGVGVPDHFKFGISACSDVAKATRLDADIRNLWTEMLTAQHPGESATNPPDPDAWHERFGLIVGAASRAGELLFPFGRHVAADCGAVYPAFAAASATYLRDLDTPLGSRMSYDDIFERAKSSVSEVWGLVASGVLANDTRFEDELGDWNLDTGRDPSGRHVFWS